MAKINITNLLLKKLQDLKLYGILSKLIFLMYKRKGKDIKEVSFIEELGVWEFKIGSTYFYSSGPGWVYDYDYLLGQFKRNLGFYYLPKEGDVVVDVGAGVGEEMLIFSKLVGDTGKVYAIEAHPVTFKALSLNKEKNKLHNVELLHFAVSDAPGSIFIQSTDNSLANKVTSDGDDNAYKVQAITFDQMTDMYGIKNIDFVKVNIEGAERLLVKGMNTSIPKIKQMAISCHDFRYMQEGDEFFKTKEIILAFLREHKFQITLRDTDIALLDDYVYVTTQQRQ